MSVQPRPLIMKIEYRPRRRNDDYTDILTEHGFQVINAASLKEGLRYGERSTPSLIITVDNLRRDIDAERWLQQQHHAVSATLATTPLLILADDKRSTRLRVHELPGRVKILPHKISPDQLLQEVHHILGGWLF